MTIRPPLRERARLTLVPEGPAQVLLDPLEVGSSVRAARLAACASGPRLVAQPPDELLGLADGEALRRRRSPRTLGLGVGRRGRRAPGRGPRAIWPSATASWTPGRRSSRRSVLATVDRARPTRVGDLLLGQPELVDELAVRARPPRSG